MNPASRSDSVRGGGRAAGGPAIAPGNSSGVVPTDMVSVTIDDTTIEVPVGTLTSRLVRGRAALQSELTPI